MTVITRYLSKQIAIILLSTLLLAFICDEYEAWTITKSCQQKCQVLGLNKGKIQKTAFNNELNLCRCLADTDYYLVMN